MCSFVCICFGMGYLNKSFFRVKLRQRCLQFLIQFSTTSLCSLLPEKDYESTALDLQAFPF